MSFGWSAGDVIAGLNALWNVWQAVSDGPLNAKYEASLFFDDFHHVIGRLEDWEKRKDACARDDRLVRSHRELRHDCTEFIKKQFSLIQHVNPGTKAIRAGRTTWLQKVSFTRAQVDDLYRQVAWPTQRDAVMRLREKLRFFLQLTALDIALDTNRAVNNISSTHSELIATNYRLVTSHLDLVQSITANLRRQTQGVDYAIPFERALHLPPPIAGLIERGPNHNEITPWSGRRQGEEGQLLVINSRNPEVGDGGAFGQEEVRGLITQRLDNLSIRVRKNDNMDTISESESGSQDTIQPPTQHLLDRLRVIRAQIGDALGVADHVPQNETSLVITDPDIALRKELEAWDNMKERIEREILHPPPPLRLSPTGEPTVQRVWTTESTTSGEDVVLPYSNTNNPKLPMTIQPRPGSLSPTVSHHGWTGPSSNRNPGSLSSSPNDRRMSSSPTDRRMSSHSRSNSTSSAPRRPSIRSDHEFQVHLIYSRHTIKATIRSISKNDEGEVQTISTYSTDGLTRYRHAVDHESENLGIETSMTPFVDNHHVVKSHLDQIPKLRVQFKGTHNLKVLQTQSRGEVVIATHPVPPIYKFLNMSDFLEFQSVLLNKEVKHIADMNIIRSHAGKEICRVGTARILLEPFSRTRHILYFQHMNLPSEQKAGFMEVPVAHFSPPKEPSRKILTLERQGGSRLSSPRGIRFGIMRTGSVNTIASNETSAASASVIMGGQVVRGLALEFYDAAACHKFWEEFTKTEPLPISFEQGDGLGLNFQPGFSVQMPDV